MTNERRYAQLIGILLAFGSAVGAVGCMVTGLRLEGFSWPVFLLGCGLSALLCGAGLGRKLWPAVPCLLGLTGILLWFTGSLAQSTEYLLYQISSLYHTGYGWGILQWSETLPTQAGITLSLWYVGSVVVFAVAWTCLRGRSAWAGCTATFLPLCACMVLTDTVPRKIFLFGVLLSILLQLLTQQTRRTNLRKANRLTAFLLLPVALALGLLFLLVPQQGYDGQYRAEQLGQWVESLLPQQILQPVTPSRAEETVNLAAVGPQYQQKPLVMQVRAEESGPMYLRGMTYDVYTGTTWTVDKAPSQWDTDFSSTGETKTLHITTTQTLDILYTPYVPVALDRLENVENAYRLREYSVDYRTAAAITEGHAVSNIPEKYLRLPKETYEAATQLLAAQLPQLQALESPWETALAIRNYVNQSATYDLLTPSMPRGREDFALWFLEESETGYCTHFASAAVVLLRAAGIPARYVTGYLFEARAGEAVAVRWGNAHAWAECYIGGVGWVVLEPTPAGGITSTLQSGEASTATTTTTAPTVESEDATIPTNSETGTPTQPSTSEPQPSVEPTVKSEAKRS